MEGEGMAHPILRKHWRWPRVALRAAACGLVALLPRVVPEAAGAPPLPSRSIDDYLLFAYEQLSFKGDDTGADTRGVIVGGNVGVNLPDAQNPPLPRLSMGGGGSPHQVFLSDGTQVVADTARLDSDSNLFDLFVNRLVGGSPPIVRDSGPTPFAAPIIDPAALPVLPAFGCDPAAPVSVPEDGSASLAPGTYGDVRVHDGATLALGAGTYTMCSLSGGKRMRVLTDAATVVQIAVDFSSNDGSFVGPACSARFLVRSDGLGVHDATVSFGRGTEIHGSFFAPNGQIRLGHHTDLFGRFWGEEIGSDFNVNVTGCDCGNGVVDPGEQCDDGNNVDDDGCSSNCRSELSFLCGNGVVDPGEECDDGNQVDGDGCTTACRLEEICNDLIDNDGDGLIDCLDPDCPACPPIRRDPAIIRFRPQQPGHDLVTVHGRIDPTTPIDPAHEEVGVVITNDDGVVYRGLLEAGDLKATGMRAFHFLDRAAKNGTSQRDGLYAVQIVRHASGYRMQIQASSDLGAATLPSMSTQFKVGDDMFLTTSNWKRTPIGWRLDQLPPK
jgi:cysteine-rich repeat protein